MIVALTSPRSSPGVTSLAVGMAYVWQELGYQPLLVEADPAGGVLGLRFDLPSEPSFTTLSADLRRGADPQRILDNTTTIQGVRTLLSSVDPAQAGRVLARSAGILAAELPSLRRPVAIDAGRLAADSPAIPLVQAAHLVLVVCRPRVEEAQSMLFTLRLLRGLGCRCGLVLVGDNPHDPHEIARLAGVPLVAVLPDDAILAAALTGGLYSEKRLKRSLLWRSIAALSRSVLQGAGGTGQQPAPAPLTTPAPAAGATPTPGSAPAPLTIPATPAPTALPAAAIPTPAAMQAAVGPVGVPTALPAVVGPVAVPATMAVAVTAAIGSATRSLPAAATAPVPVGNSTASPTTGMAVAAARAFAPPVTNPPVAVPAAVPPAAVPPVAAPPVAVPSATPPAAAPPAAAPQVAVPAAVPSFDPGVTAFGTPLPAFDPDATSILPAGGSRPPPAAVPAGDAPCPAAHAAPPPPPSPADRPFNPAVTGEVPRLDLTGAPVPPPPPVPHPAPAPDVKAPEVMAPEVMAHWPPPTPRDDRQPAPVQAMVPAAANREGLR